MRVSIEKGSRIIEAYCYRDDAGILWDITHYTNIGKKLCVERRYTSFYILELMKGADRIEVYD